jgi:hypothetical protein
VPGFAVPLELRSAAGDLRIITTLTTFATAAHVTLDELHLEAFLPADEGTAEDQCVGARLDLHAPPSRPNNVPNAVSDSNGTSGRHSTAWTTVPTNPQVSAVIGTRCTIPMGL